MCRRNKSQENAWELRNLDGNNLQIKVVTSHNNKFVK